MKLKKYKIANKILVIRNKKMKNNLGNKVSQIKILIQMITN